MTIDISKSVEPRSDQLNFDDVQSRDLLITIVKVKQGPPDQPVELHNAEFEGRPYKPGKSMRRVLIAAWGADASAYVGRRVLLYGDPTIRFGKEAVGGIRIRALSHIPKPLTVPLTVTRGRREPYTVGALGETVTVEDAGSWLLEAETLADLQEAWRRVRHAGLAGNGELVELKDERKVELSAPDS